MNIRELCDRSGITPDPSFYSGRGATTSDLNSLILGKIHTGIRQQVGDDAAAAFVRLVAAFPVPSASAFLNGLFALEANNWVFDARQAQASGICPDNFGSAFATVENVLSRVARTGDADDARWIEEQRAAQVRGSFLMQHMRSHQDARRMYGDR